MTKRFHHFINNSVNITMMNSSDEEPTTSLKGMAFEQYCQQKADLEKQNVEDQGDTSQVEGASEEMPAKKKGKGKAANKKKDSTTVKNKPEKPEKEEKADKKEWNDNEIMDFIDMLEENPCLWDVFHKDYSKRDIKEIAYTNMATAFETNVSSVKTKINGLRAQLG